MLPSISLAVLCLGAILSGCTAFSVQSNRRISVGYCRSVTAKTIQHDVEDDASTLFRATPNSNTNALQLDQAPTRKKSLRGDDSDDTDFNKYCKERAPSQLLHSLALVATGRRIAFLFLSVSLVNFVRSTILKIPKSGKRVFDQCPWPFTLFHDPIKFVKTGATHVLFLWAALCQIYSRVEKARAIIP